METMTVTLIQFHSGIDLTGGNGEVCRNSIYYLCDIEDEYQFLVGEDDNGEDEFDTRRAISVFDCLDDLNNNEFHYYVSGRGLKYSTIEIEVPMTEDGRPIFKQA
jgi:hypothetical protein